MDKYWDEGAGGSSGDTGSIARTRRIVCLPAEFEPDILAVERIGYMRHGMKHEHAGVAEYRHRLRFRPRAVYIGPALTTPPAP